jgi:hypothetical protein
MIELTKPFHGNYDMTLDFGKIYDPVLAEKLKKDFHRGMDWMTPENTCIFASAPGMVVRAETGTGLNEGYGKFVKVNHGNGYSTLYAHLSKISVAVNTEVSTETIIGLSGDTGNSTGPHLHFELKTGDTPVDPNPFFRQEVIKTYIPELPSIDELPERWGRCLYTVNYRNEPSTQGDDLGDKIAGDTFAVLEVIYENGNIWFKIGKGPDGNIYIAGQHNNKTYVEILGRTGLIEK